MKYNSDLAIATLDLSVFLERCEDVSKRIENEIKKILQENKIKYNDVTYSYKERHICFLNLPEQKFYIPVKYFFYIDDELTIDKLLEQRLYYENTQQCHI